MISVQVESALLILFCFIAIVFFIYILSSTSEVIGNWCHLFFDMKYEPEQFYTLVEEKLKELEVPNLQTSRTMLKEGDFTSHNRLYLEVSRGDYIYHIGAAPWGTGFFFSWWVRQQKYTYEIVFAKIPLIGRLYAFAANYNAYYKLDTDAAFRASVQQSVQAAIDSLTNEKGIKGLTELERQPDLRSIFKK